MNQKENIGKVGLNQLAEELGISVSTVSRALNDHPKISKKTKERVISLAIQMGYKSGVPSLFSEQKTKAIALVIPNTNNAFYDEITLAVRELCEQQNMVLFVCETNYNQASEKLYLEQIELMKFQGAIYLAHEISDKLEILERLLTKNFPLVFVNEYQTITPNTSVLLDVYKSLSDSIAHLKSNGAKKITLVLEDFRDSLSAKIKGLFNQILEDEDLESFPESIIHLKNQLSDFENMLKNWENNSSCPDALIVGSHKLALEIQNSVHQSQFLSGKNLLLISLNQECRPTFTRSKISYLDLRAKQIGKDAAQLLFEQFKNDVGPKTKLHFSKLIIKSSSIKKA